MRSTTDNVTEDIDKTAETLAQLQASRSHEASAEGTHHSEAVHTPTDACVPDGTMYAPRETDPYFEEIER